VARAPRLGHVERRSGAHHASGVARAHRAADDGGRFHVEMAAGIILILISILMIVFIVRTVQANMVR
jgi:hypothetical protein